MSKVRVLVIISGFVITAIGGGLIGASAGREVQAQTPSGTSSGTQAGCTNGDLRGSFAFKTTDAQVFLPGAGVLHAAFIGDATFDGRGSVVAGKAIEAQNGQLDPNVTYTGSYSVEPSCRGTLTITATHTSPPGRHTHNVALRLVGRPGNIERFYFMEVTGANNPAPGIVNLVGEGERMPVTIDPGD